MGPMSRRRFGALALGVAGAAATSWPVRAPGRQRLLVDGDRLNRRLGELARFSSAAEGTTRLAYSEEDRAARAWLSANERRLQMRRKWHEFFKDWDAVLLPNLPTTAIPHDHSSPMGARRITVNGEQRPYGEQTLWVGLTGVAYLPATVIPAGTAADGLPVGLQIAGPFLEDRTTLDLGRRLSRRIGGFERPPGY